MPDLADLSVPQALKVLHAGEISSLALTRACLDRVEALEGQLHAFITVASEKAEQSAKVADARLSELRHTSQPIPPLLGLPIVVKDVLCVQDIRCTCGSKILENFIPPFSATAVQKLLDAGVVVLGKTNTDEFAMGSSTENSAFGPTHNPWDFHAYLVVPAVGVLQLWPPALSRLPWVLIPAVVCASPPLFAG